MRETAFKKRISNFVLAKIKLKICRRAFMIDERKVVFYLITDNKCWRSNWQNSLVNRD